ncbi:MAG: (2Fe-2S)-binding protein [Chloroflexi bacterium]|nr:(2Fe-2S)-binding protein [Chloroflexota bacterium]
MKKRLKLRVNGEDIDLFAEPSRLLKDVLREDLDLTGLKEGCSSGYCGACTVLIDNKAVKSCLVVARQAQGHEITTIEGLAHDGRLHPIQQAFIDRFAVQCGYCTSGMILASKALLDCNPNPTEDDVKKALVGNLCRCTGYVKIVEAVLAAADMMRSSAREGEKV